MEQYFEIFKPLQVDNVDSVEIHEKSYEKVGWIKQFARALGCEVNYGTEKDYLLRITKKKPIKFDCYKMRKLERRWNRKLAARRRRLEGKFIKITCRDCKHISNVDRYHFHVLKNFKCTHCSGNR
jgi:ribosomal protein S27E